MPNNLLKRKKHTIDSFFPKIGALKPFGNHSNRGKGTRSQTETPYWPVKNETKYFHVLIIIKIGIILNNISS